MDKITRFLDRIRNAELPLKRWNTIVISAAAGIISLAALTVLIVDPYYRYHEPWFYDKVYYEIYATAPSILKNEDFDLLMLGTSMTRNFFIEDIEKAFDCRAVKFAASGGTAGDMVKFLNVAKKNKGDDLRQVIFAIDIYPLNKDYTHWKDFEYLYRDDHGEDYRYFFSRQTHSSMIYLVKRKLSPKRQRPHQSDRNRMFATEYKGKPYGLQPVLKDAVKNEEIHHTQTPFDPEVHRRNFYGGMLPFFDNNPQIKFIVFLPPYHIYTYCQSEHFNEAEGLIRQRSEVMKELLKRPNLVLYDFQSDSKYVTNHDFFSDVQHFSNVAAKEILQDILNGRRQITSAADVDANEQELRDVIRENMPLYYQHVKEFRAGSRSK